MFFRTNAKRAKVQFSVLSTHRLLSDYQTEPGNLGCEVRGLTISLRLTRKYRNIENELGEFREIELKIRLVLH